MYGEWSEQDEREWINQQFHACMARNRSSASAKDRSEGQTTDRQAVTVISAQDLHGGALNYAVAKAEGWVFQTKNSSWFGDEPWFERQNEKGTYRCRFWELDYSGSPSHGQPIIERERICVSAYFDSKNWNASTYSKYGARLFISDGPTALVAAMRCYVSSKLGNSIEVPTTLAKEQRS